MVTKSKITSKSSMHKLISSTKPSKPSISKVSKISKFKPFRESKINEIDVGYNTVRVIKHTADDKNGKMRSTILHRNLKAHNPTLAELKKFLLSPQVKKIMKKPYIEGKYVCADYSAELNNLANKSGIICGFVEVYYKHGLDGHGMCVFNTTDSGYIFVDPTHRVVYDEKTFLGKKDFRKSDKLNFFRESAKNHYQTESGRKINIKDVDITW